MNSLHAKQTFNMLDITNLQSRLMLVYLLNVFDLIATTLWVIFFGLGIEANPIARWMYETNIIYVVKTIGVSVGLCILNSYLPANKKWMWVSWLLIFVYFGIAVYHCFIATQLFFIFL